MAKKAAGRPAKYWLFKSEADCYSIDHLAKEKNQTTFWDGVRNYQARNMLRDDVQPGDGVLFYHSNSDPLAVAGICEVVRAGYPDHTAFDKSAQHYDAKSSPDNPTWYMVDLKLVKKFEQQVTRDQLKAEPALDKMVVLQKGSRLSIMPVTAEEWKTVCRLGGVKLPM
ncbi:EVE domain-containing protein [Planctomicrobium piriforme]|uniref:Predicted RNA-binding protein, contains PUA-like domain n=1 Tax=Planctomicrobium piriforme TaxID=1576369 RepID=A0A1I3SWP7_9PLAN|nr:EVE domain-containing protein [Planctomicrobium piriforme]SFJ63294.1 Predicted RNA-binding protein, contains PUA-like domain [Planctomicrobium piriforme]